MSTDQKGCTDRNECLDLPCLNGASCINLEPKYRYRCVCLDGFWGENCEMIQEGQTLKLSMGALAAILVCLLVILSEHKNNMILEINFHHFPLEFSFFFFVVCSLHFFHFFHQNTKVHLEFEYSHFEQKHKSLHRRRKTSI